MSFLLIAYLYEENKRKNRFVVKDVVDDIFGKAEKRDSKEYEKLRHRFSHHNLPRLREASIIGY